MRARLSTLWACIAILLCIGAQTATTATVTCEKGDPYKDSGKVVEACSKLLGTAATPAEEKLVALRQRAEAHYWANRDELALMDLDAAIRLDPKSVSDLAPARVD